MQWDVKGDALFCSDIVLTTIGLVAQYHSGQHCDSQGVVRVTVWARLCALAVSRLSLLQSPSHCTWAGAIRIAVSPTPIIMEVFFWGGGWRHNFDGTFSLADVGLERQLLLMLSEPGQCGCSQGEEPVTGTSSCPIFFHNTFLISTLVFLKLQEIMFSWRTDMYYSVTGLPLWV